MRKVFRGLAALAAIVELGCAAWAFGQGPVYGVAAPAYSTQPSAFSTYAQANGVVLNGAGPGSGSPGMTGPQFLPPTTPSPFIDPIDRPVEAAPSSLYSPAGHGSDGLWGVCDECPNRGLVAFVGYDTWRSIVDGNWQNNGIHSGVNFGTRLGRFSDWTGIGFQIGASVGAYNWSGTDYRLSHQDQAQPQGFVTYGFFRKANETSSWSAAVVQDWMLNSNYGVMAQNPTLGQWRGQAGYALNAWHEFGVWGAVRLYSDSRKCPALAAPTGGPSIN